MNWQVRYLMGERLGLGIMGDLNSALNEAKRLIEAGFTVLRIEAPTAGCAITAEMVQRLCAGTPPASAA